MRGYHDGERAVQRRAGAEAVAIAERLERGIRAELPGPARAFLAEQRLLLAGSTDPGGRVWCSLLSGPPGFVATPDERTVAIAALPHAGDPLADALAAGTAPVGLLGIEPQTRRRIRVNGIAERDEGGVTVHTEQVYANCPKYIARRTVAEDAGADRPARAAVRRDVLSPADRARIARADTFFIATAAPDGAADASHRGGSPASSPSTATGG